MPTDQIEDIPFAPLEDPLTCWSCKHSDVVARNLYCNLQEARLLDNVCPCGSFKQICTELKEPVS